MKSYDVTIQMKPLWLNFCMVVFIFKDFTKGNLEFFWKIFTLTTVKNKRVNTKGIQ